MARLHDSYLLLISQLQLLLRRNQDCSQALTSPQAFTGPRAHHALSSLSADHFPHYLNRISRRFSPSCHPILLPPFLPLYRYRFLEFHLESFLLRKPKSPSSGGQAGWLLLAPEPHKQCCAWAGNVRPRQISGPGVSNPQSRQVICVSHLPFADKSPGPSAPWLLLVSGGRSSAGNPFLSGLPRTICIHAEAVAFQG